MSFVVPSGKALHFQDDLVRNIKSIRTSQALFDDITGDDQDAAVARAAQAQGSGRAVDPLMQRPFEYGTVITYSFDATHWQATRFSDARSYGVWYGSLALATTVYETVFHWHRFIRDAFADIDRTIRGERRVFAVSCDAILIDLRGAERRHPGLADRKNYTYCQELGRRLVAQQQNGLLVVSARQADGVNAAIFNGARLSNVRDLCYLTYNCNPRVDRVTVERTPRRTWMTVVPSVLY